MANALELSARHSEVVHSAIKHWVDSGILSESKATLLADSIAVQGFDWNKFAKYTLRLAVLCFVVAVSSTVFEKRFARFFKWLLAMPAWVRGTATGLMAVGVHIFAHQRSQQVPEQKWGNEAIHGVGALAFAGAAFQVLEQLNSSFRAVSSNEKDGPTSKVNQEERQRLERNAVQCVMLGLAAVYGAVGVISGSNFIWSCSMMVLGYCCGGMTGYM